MENCRKADDAKMAKRNGSKEAFLKDFGICHLSWEILTRTDQFTIEQSLKSQQLMKLMCIKTAQTKCAVYKSRS